MSKATSSDANRVRLGRALASAASVGDIEQCKALLAQGADVNWRQLEGREVPALHWAAQYGRVELARVLIAAGADVNMAEIGGARALTWAISCMTNDDIIRVLLEAGAEPNYGTKAGNTPLSLAVKGKDMPVIRMLVEHGARPTYIPEGAEPETVSAMQEAVIRGYAEAVEFFAGACDEDFDQIPADGKTLIDLAKGNPRVLCVLRAIHTDRIVRHSVGGDPASASPIARASTSLGPL